MYRVCSIHLDQVDTVLMIAPAKSRKLKTCFQESLGKELACDELKSTPAVMSDMQLHM
jgi:hypothetical protein